MNATYKPEEAEKIKRWNVCSACWGELIEQYDYHTRTSTLHCDTEGCECPGYVSRKFVDRREGESTFEAIEAKQALHAAVPWLPKKSETDLLKELGF